jgi:hypothetical protein
VCCGVKALERIRMALGWCDVHVLLYLLVFVPILGVFDKRRTLHFCLAKSPSVPFKTLIYSSWVLVGNIREVYVL